MKESNSIPGNFDENQKQFKGIEKINPFSVPDAYFEQLPGKIMSSIESLPNFESVSEVNPFEVPTNYFEKLPGTITDAIHEKNKPVGIVHRIFAGDFIIRPKITFALIAASLVLLVGIRYFTKESVINDTKQEFTLEELDRLNVLTSVDESMITEIFNTQIDLVSNEENNSAIEQYLIENDFDINQIESKL